MALFIGFLVAAAVFSLLRRSVFRLIIGLMFLSQAANLIVFTAGGLVAGESAVIPGDQTVLSPTAADPLPQALVLTAIVIGFGMLAFAIALIYRASRAVNSHDLNRFKTTESD
jgi:multicomponent Na+:H+ antiporter subunit C